MATLEPAQIVDRATRLLQERLRSPIWTASLGDAIISPTPLLVTSIAPRAGTEGHKRPNLRDYYIVSITRPNGISARFALDAETGNFLEAQGVRRPGAFLRTFVDAEEVVRSRMPVPPGLPKAELVWQPCRESTSRFLPFWRFRIEGRILYVRADGLVFEELTTTGRG